MNSGLTSYQQRGHTETGPRFKVSSERQEKREINLAIPGLIVYRLCHKLATENLPFFPTHMHWLITGPDLADGVYGNYKCTHVIVALLFFFTRLCQK